MQIKTDLELHCVQKSEDNLKNKVIYAVYIH